MTTTNTYSSGRLLKSRQSTRWPVETRMFYAASFGVLVPATIAVALLWNGDYPARVRWTLAVLIAMTSAPAIFYLKNCWTYSLRSVSNLLFAIRENDFSFRLLSGRSESAMDELIDEANEVRDLLHYQRIQVAESAALLDRVLASIDLAVLAFDSHNRLRQANRCAEVLLGARFESLEGKSAHELGLDDCLKGSVPRVVELLNDRVSRRWEVRRTTVRQLGEPVQLVVLWDMTVELRSEQLEAWSRLIRVMRHEINNSLAPIQSLAGALQLMIGRTSQLEELREDILESLQVIAGRSTALTRMLQSYTELSCEPPPDKRMIDVDSLVQRVATAETRTKVLVIPGPKATISADAGQIDRALVNLVRNAVDANLTLEGRTEIGWTMLTLPFQSTSAAPQTAHEFIEFWIDDEGAGLCNTDNLFVPFYSTKPGGSGIGLALARQIAEAHGGSLTLVNRPGKKGCRASMRIPIQ